jgi:hypothetical protein
MKSTASKSMSNLSRIYDLSCRIFASRVELNQTLPNLIDLDAAPVSHLILALDSAHEKFAV